ncbi:MAG: c-type cytochrome, partial [Gammaproteobacteria bacterium]
MRALGALLGGALIALAWPASPPLAADGDPAHGARVYNARCVLCHGGKGMGEGFLPLKLDDYPSTNLRDSDAVDLAVIERAVRTGSGSGSPSPYSPPWQNELGDDDIRAVAAFVRLLRTDVEAAIALLDATHDESVRADGGNLYATRCAICHGAGGTGDGKMSKII